MEYKDPILVVGAGYVGLSTATFMADKGRPVTVVEKNPTTLASLNKGQLHFREPRLAERLALAVKRGRLKGVEPQAEPFVRARTIIIAIDSVNPKDWSMRSDDFIRMARWIGDESRTGRAMVILKSTNILGFSDWYREQLANTDRGDKLDLAVCPEFLREGYAYEDTAQPWRVVVGADDPAARRRAAKFYRQFYGDKIPFVTVAARAAELIKLSSNLYLSHRLAFIHEIAEYARHHDLDIDAIGQGIGLDPRIGSDYLKPGLGFGGSCLPKDCHLINSRELGQSFSFGTARTALEVNTMVLEGVIESLKSRLGSLRGKRIGFWGAAFKPESDDVRGSAVVNLATMLTRRGAKIIIHDPYLTTTESVAPGRLTLAPDRFEVLKGASALVVGVAHKRFARWYPGPESKKMKARLIVDRFGILNRGRWIGSGFEFI